MQRVTAIKPAKGATDAGLPSRSGKSAKPALVVRAAHSLLERLKNWFNPERKQALQRSRAEFLGSDDDIVWTGADGSTFSAKTSTRVSGSTTHSEDAMCIIGSLGTSESETSESEFLSSSGSGSWVTSEPALKPRVAGVAIGRSKQVRSANNALPGRGQAVTTALPGDGTSVYVDAINPRSARTGRKQAEKIIYSPKSSDAQGSLPEKSLGKNLRAFLWEIGGEKFETTRSNLEDARAAADEARGLKKTPLEIENDRRAERNLLLILRGSLPVEISAVIKQADVKGFISAVLKDDYSFHPAWKKIAARTPDLRSYIEGMLAAIESSHPLGALHPDLRSIVPARHVAEVNEWCTSMNSYVIEKHHFGSIQGEDVRLRKKYEDAGIPFEKVPSPEQWNSFEQHRAGAAAVRRSLNRGGVLLGTLEKGEGGAQIKGKKRFIPLEKPLLLTVEGKSESSAKKGGKQLAPMVAAAIPTAQSTSADKKLQKLTDGSGVVALVLNADLKLVLSRAGAKPENFVKALRKGDYQQFNPQLDALKKEFELDIGDVRALADAAHWASEYASTYEPSQDWAESLGKQLGAESFAKVESRLSDAKARLLFESLPDTMQTSALALSRKEWDALLKMLAPPHALPSGGKLDKFVADLQDHAQKVTGSNDPAYVSKVLVARMTAIASLKRYCAS